MLKKIKQIICIALFITLILPSSAYARVGDSGYEGGMSLEQVTPGTTTGKAVFDYQEVSFITGEPIVFKGTLTVTKTLRQGVVASTYVYNLANADKAATLTRTLALQTKLTTTDSGQTIEETSFTRVPAEAITIGDITYALSSYALTRTNLIDAKPAVNYSAGSITGTKIYRLDDDAASKTVEVKITGNFYGYDQYWGSGEVGTFEYYIGSDAPGTVDDWGGTATVSFSANNTKELRYEEIPNLISSIQGGYIQTQKNSSILEYSGRLPLFDSQGRPTDTMVTYGNSLQMERTPTEVRLPIPNISHLKGHWAENDIKALFSLEVFSGNDTIFDPEQFMSRGEFAAAMSKAAREVPPDPLLTARTTGAARTTGRNVTVTSPFKDVSTEDINFPGINDAFKRGLISGKAQNIFGPDENLTVADALTIFVRAMGLESMAPAAGPVTTFRDNDQIPEYARKAAYVAQNIGLIRGDERGYLNPGANLTKARASAMINRFIDYMRNNIKQDYRNVAIGYGR